jgi:hypothetical protein
MTKKHQDGELSEQQLDGIAGGQQQVVKMGTIVVEGKRQKPEAKPQVVKMETIVVTAQREKPDLAGTKLAQSDSKSKKN